MLHPVQVEIFKKMTAEDKLVTSMRLYHSAWELKTAVLRQQHPDWDESQVEAKVRDIFLNART